MRFVLLLLVVVLLRSYGPNQLGSALAEHVFWALLVRFVPLLLVVVLLRSYGQKQLRSASIGFAHLLVFSAALTSFAVGGLQNAMFAYSFFVVFLFFFGCVLMGRMIFCIDFFFCLNAVRCIRQLIAQDKCIDFNDYQ